MLTGTAGWTRETRIVLHQINSAPELVELFCFFLSWINPRDALGGDGGHLKTSGSLSLDKSLSFHRVSRGWRQEVSGECTESHTCRLSSPPLCVCALGGLVKRMYVHTLNDVRSASPTSLHTQSPSSLISYARVWQGLTLRTQTDKASSKTVCAGPVLYTLFALLWTDLHVGGYLPVWLTPCLTDHPLLLASQLSLCVSRCLLLLLSRQCLS